MKIKQWIGNARVNSNKVAGLFRSVGRIVVGVIVSIVGVIISILPFLFEGLKDGKQGCNFYRLPDIIVTPDAVIASLGLFGTFATIVGLVYAVLQTIESKKTVELLVETKPLANSQDVLDEFEERIKDKRFPVTEVYLMANTIAIGATGDLDRFKSFKVVLVGQINKLRSKFHAAYINLILVNTTDANGQPNESFDQVSFEGLKILYIDKFKFPKNDQLQEIFRLTKELHREVKQCQVDYRALTHADSTGPHFILINPGGKDRLGIIWNIKMNGSGHTNEVVLAGFRTTNRQVIETMKSIFEQQGDETK